MSSWEAKYRSDVRYVANHVVLARGDYPSAGGKSVAHTLLTYPQRSGPPNYTTIQKQIKKMPTKKLLDTLAVLEPPDLEGATKVQTARRVKLYAARFSAIYNELELRAKGCRAE